MTDDDRRLAQRLRAYESRVPDPPAPTTSLAGGRMPWAIAGLGAAAVLVGAVVAGNLLDEPAVGDVPSPSPSPSAIATPSATPGGSLLPSATAAPSDSPAPSTPAPTAPPQAAISGVAWDDTAGTIDGSVYRVTAEGGLFYALGSLDFDSAAVWSSSDGSTWRAFELPFPSEWGPEPGSVLASNMASVDGRLVVVGTVSINDYLEPVVWESTDGIEWQEVDSGDFRLDAFNVLDVSAGPAELVAITHEYGAGSGSAWRSADGGRTWTEHTLPGDAPTATVVVGTTRGYLIGGAVGESYDAEVTSSPRIWHSPDGTGSSWQPASVEGSGGRGMVDQLAIDGSGRWVAIGTLNGRVVAWQSVDRGLSWAVVADLGVPDGSGRSGFRVVGAPDGFVAVSGSDPAVTWTSVDGASWQQGPPLHPGGVRDGLQLFWQPSIARIGDRVVVVGEAHDPAAASERAWVAWAGVIVR
jgi:hypothetical protein